MTVPAYVWQPSTAEIAARAGIPAAEVIRADQNTSPFRPRWAGEVAAAAAAGVNDYPAAAYLGLREAIARHTGAEPAMVVPGAGADELILLAARAWLQTGGVAAAESPTYSLYRIATLQSGARYVEAPREPGSAFPVTALAGAAAEADLTWLCVPTNPIGDRPTDGEVAAVVAAARGITVIDAAYAEFAGDRWGAYAAANPGVVVLGTLSKAFGLAGARVGYALADPESAGLLDRLRPPGSISSVSVAMAERALAGPDWMEEHVARVTGLRGSLESGLRSLGLDPIPSSANFVLVGVPDAASVAGRLMDRGIVVRTFARPGGHLRITVRRPEEQERLLQALGEEIR
jgi:histidinol-phosphate aminotransferase